jgi:hypothetical protein
MGGHFGLILAALVGVALAPACSSSGGDVEEASCQACSGATYTEADCKTWGDAAGCASSAFAANPSAACKTGCTFKSCNAPPTCGSAFGGGDAGATTDAAVDPACSRTTNGFWSSDPPCKDTSTVTINGATQYACKCSSSCPCHFQCGSIALASGGTIGNVCAP